MPIGADAWTSSIIAVVALAGALIGMADRNAQLRNYDETIAKLRDTLDGGSDVDHRTTPRAPVHPSDDARHVRALSR